MALEIQGKPGLQQLQDGALNTVRTAKDGGFISQDAHGRYQEAVYRGNVYFAANQAAVTFAASLSTTAPLGLILENPPASKKNLVLLQLGYVQIGTTAANIALCYAPYQATAFTNTTTITINPAFVGGSSTSVAWAGSSAAVAAALVVAMPVYANLVTQSVNNTTVLLDLGGQIVLAPGTAAAVTASAATTGIVSLLWEEIPQ